MQTDPTCSSSSVAIRAAGFGGLTILDQDDILITSATARAIAGGVSDMTLWRWVQDGIIPAPLKIRRRNFWPKSLFLASLADAGRNAGTTAASAG
jgi:hypothetical protein